MFVSPIIGEPQVSHIGWLVLLALLAEVKWQLWKSNDNQELEEKNQFPFFVA
jgi:hypothetical protein